MTTPTSLVVSQDDRFLKASMRYRQRTAWSSSALWDAAFRCGLVRVRLCYCRGRFHLVFPYCDSSFVYFSVFLDGSVFGFIDEFVANVLC